MKTASATAYDRLGRVLLKPSLISETDAAITLAISFGVCWHRDASAVWSATSHFINHIHKSHPGHSSPTFQLSGGSRSGPILRLFLNKAISPLSDGFLEPETDVRILGTINRSPLRQQDSFSKITWFSQLVLLCKLKVPGKWRGTEMHS